ncbi:hypothetical protein Tco_0321037 [Tanacetum coccineum]
MISFGSRLNSALFNFSDRRLELSATFSISTNLQSEKINRNEVASVSFETSLSYFEWLGGFVHSSTGSMTVFNVRQHLSVTGSMTVFNVKQHLRVNLLKGVKNEKEIHGPSDAMHNPLPATQSQKDFVSKLTEIHSFLLTFSLRNIRSDSFTMKMEILLESTSNKLMVGNGSTVFSISIGEIVTHWFTLIVLSALRRSDNEKMLSRSSRIRRLCKMVVEVPDSSWLTRSITTCSYPTDKHKVIMKAQGISSTSATPDTTHLRSVEVLKLKKFQERCNIKAFQEWYEHVGPEVASPQGGKVSKMAKRLCLVDDLKMLKIIT